MQIMTVVDKMFEVGRGANRYAMGHMIVRTLAAGVFKDICFAAIQGRNPIELADDGILESNASGLRELFTSLPGHPSCRLLFVPLLVCILHS